MRLPIVMNLVNGRFPMADRQPYPPTEIALFYRTVGKTHVFTADGFQGFYIGSSDLRRAFDHLAPALSDHVSRVLECDAWYTTEWSFDAFKSHLAQGRCSGNFIRARRNVAEDAHVC